MSEIIKVTDYVPGRKDPKSLYWIHMVYDPTTRTARGTYTIEGGEMRSAWRFPNTDWVADSDGTFIHRTGLKEDLNAVYEKHKPEGWDTQVLED